MVLTKKSVLIGVIAGLLPATQVLATAVPTTANIIEITATSGDFSATFSEIFPVASAGGFEGVESWTLDAPITLMDGATMLGTIDTLDVSFDADPQVDLSFAVTNSSSTNAIMYNIRTATIAFTPIANAQAAASASITATDGAIDQDLDVQITGLFAGGACYEARYSTDFMVNTETLFDDLVDSFDGEVAQSVTETSPFVSLGTAVYSMESEFKFGLSAGDQASGTSTFVLIPEPASMLLLSLGGLLIRRR